LNKLFDQTNNYAEAYRVGLSRASVMRPVLVTGPGGWMRKSNRNEKVWTYKLNLWCLNPAVVCIKYFIYIYIIYEPIEDQ